MEKTPGKRNPGTERPAVATRDKLNVFLDQLAALKSKLQHEEETKQQEAIRAYLQRIGRQELQRLISRAFADALKSPSQKLGTAKPPSPGRPTAEKRERAGKGKKHPNKGGRRASRRGAAR